MAFPLRVFKLISVENSSLICISYLYNRHSLLYFNNIYRSFTSKVIQKNVFELLL